jgi:hypothetical protein
MDVLTRSGFHFERSSDPLWWLVAALLGLLSLRFPQFIQSGEDRATQILLSEVALFFSGALVGALRPQRPWRWGIACFLAFVIWDLAPFAVILNSATFSFRVIGSFLLSHATQYIYQTLPVLAGAFLGASMMRGAGVRR